jgi:hypothetical protein
MANETVQYLDVEVRVSALVTGLDGAQMVKEFTRKIRFSDGTGAGQVEQVFADGARALNTTSEDLDFSGGTTDFKGAALAMTKLGVLFVENLDTDTGDTITVSRPAANGVTGMFAAASDAIIVQPGGLLLWVAPGVDKGTVTAGTADLITVAAADNSTYNLLVAG